MMNKKTQVKKLCRTFCPYYKPSKDEELACLGFLIVEKLTGKNKKISFKKRRGKPSASSVKAISQNICPECPYYEDDCDFAAEKKGALPCGGFILLGHLLDEDFINIDDMKNIL